MHVLHDPGAARGFGDHASQYLRIDAERLPDAEGLGDRDQGRARNQIVAQFGDLAGPDLTDMDDVAAHRRERRPRLFEIAGIAADHDRQCARRGAAHPARNRCIEEPDATFLEARRHSLRGAGIDCRHVDAEPPGGGLLDDPALSEIGGLDIGRGRQHRNDEVAIRRRFARRSCPPGTQPYRSVERARHDIEGDDLEALLDEVGQHRLPHRPGADESDLHGGESPLVATALTRLEAWVAWSRSGVAPTRPFDRRRGSDTPIRPSAWLRHPSSTVPVSTVGVAPTRRFNRPFNRCV